MDTALKQYLEQHNIEYQSYNHPAVYTVEEAIKVKEQIPAQHAKCLFLKSQGSSKNKNLGTSKVSTQETLADDKAKFYLVGMNAFKKLDIKLLKNKLSVKKLHFASPEELKQYLNLTPGSVSIFGMIHTTTVTFLLDQEVWDAEASGFHPNINTATLVINHENLEKFYNSLKAPKQIINLEQ